MKKIISFVLAFAMCASMTVSYAAGDTPLKAALRNYINNTIGLPIDLDDIRNIPVPADIKVSQDGGATYVNGPVSLKYSEAVATTFGFEASIDMSTVKFIFQQCKDAADAVVTADASLAPEYNSCYVKGNFTVNIDYPTTGFTVNSASATDSAMTGFSTDEVGKVISNIYEETSRGITTSPYAGYERLTINIKVKDNNSVPPATVGLTTLANDLSDLKLTYTGNTVSQEGTYTIRGSITGETEIFSSVGKIGKIVYAFDQKDGEANNANYSNPDPVIGSDISGTIIVTSDGGTSLGGGSAQVELVFVDKDGEVHKKTYKPGSVIDLSDLEKPSKPGKVFAGYFYDEELTKPVETSITVNKDTKIYCKWIDEALNADDHFAFIIGYPEENGREEVRPEINMTREEIATVFYRLLKDDVRDNLFTNENDFPDVDVERWSNKAISTMAKGGYVNGYEDGTFRPGAPITRAEFVTIAARFYAVDEDAYTADAPFTDVDGHWAEKYIKYATSCGWINGYEDNTFRPDRYITRAEVMKIINHMLGRAVNEEGLVEDAKRWVDNSADKWYYYEVIEATNFHAYEKAEDAEFETWTGILENEILVDKAEYEDA